MTLDTDSTRRITYVYIAYLDDSGSNDKNEAIQVMTAVLIRDDQFQDLETLVGIAIENLIPPERLDRFEEFHGFELFWGRGIFDGIDQRERFTAIELLLDAVDGNGLPIVYAAVDKHSIQYGMYGSANPVDVAFRICASGIEEWLHNQHNMNDLCMLIADDSEREKKQLKQSFRDLRWHLRPPHNSRGTLWQIHDAMYFGDSKDSIGIQLADLCCFFIRRELKGESIGREFYQQFRKQICWKKLEPSDAFKIKET